MSGTCPIHTPKPSKFLKWSKQVEMTHSLCVKQLCKSVTCWNRTQLPCHFPSNSMEMCHLAHNAMPSGSCLYRCVYIPSEIFLKDMLICRYSGYQLSAGSLAYQVCLCILPWFRPVVFDKWDWVIYWMLLYFFIFLLMFWLVYYVLFNFVLIASLNFNTKNRVKGRTCFSESIVRSN